MATQKRLLFHLRESSLFPRSCSVPTRPAWSGLIRSNCVKYILPKVSIGVDLLDETVQLDETFQKWCPFRCPFTYEIGRTRTKSDEEKAAPILRNRSLV